MDRKDAAMVVEADDGVDSQREKSSRRSGALP